MICASCGCKISEGDMVCPSCGKLNKGNSINIYEMYNSVNISDVPSRTKMREHKEPKISINSNADKKEKKFAIEIDKLCRLMIVFCVTVITGCLLISINSYKIRRYFVESKVERNLEEYSVLFENYENNRDVLGLVLFCEKNNLTSLSNTDLQKYYNAYLVSKYYRDMCDYIMRIADKNQLSEVYSVGKCAERIATYVECVNKTTSDMELNPDKYDDHQVEYVSYVKGLIEDSIQVYCNLSEKEAESIWDISNARLALLIEDSVGEYE